MGVTDHGSCLSSAGVVYTNLAASHSLPKYLVNIPNDLQFPS